MFLLPTIAALALVGLYVFSTEAPRVLKALLVILLVGSLVCQFRFPQLWLVALLVQVALALFVLLYLKVVSAGL
ncbi:MAG TPA: hypothetical protein PKM43_20145 [Verrucomicrobiota bacterium]|nr:hypothetical protein [Verrucomicrobiota bacterium]HRZ57143.1 hypothetical protein [Candidatus Paceibacterota bacterium]